MAGRSAAQTMIVTNTPGSSLFLTNLAYVSPPDLHKFAVPGTKLFLANVRDVFVLSLSPHQDIRSGQIALNAIQRQHASVSTDDNVSVSRFDPPEDFNLALLTLELEFVKKANKNEQVDAVLLAKQLKRQFINQVLTAGQKVTFEYHGHSYIFTVNQAAVEGAQSNAPERGMLSSDTYIVFETSNTSGIKVNKEQEVTLSKKKEQGVLGRKARRTLNRIARSQPAVVIKNLIAPYAPPNLTIDYKEEIYVRKSMADYLGKLDFLGQSDTFVEEIHPGIYRLSKKGSFIFKNLLTKCFGDIASLRPKRYKFEDLNVEDDILIVGDGTTCNADEAVKGLRDMIKEACGNKLPKDVSCLLELMVDSNQFWRNGTLILSHPCFMDADRVEKLIYSLRVFQISSQKARDHLYSAVVAWSGYDTSATNWIEYVKGFLANCQGFHHKITKGFQTVLDSNLNTIKERNSEKEKKKNSQDDDDDDYDVTGYGEHDFYEGKFDIDFTEYASGSGLIAYFRNVFYHCVDSDGSHDDVAKIFNLMYVMFPTFFSELAKAVFPYKAFQGHFS